MTIVATLLARLLKRLWRSQPMTPTSVDRGQHLVGRRRDRGGRAGRSLTQRSGIWTRTVVEVHDDRRDEADDQVDGHDEDDDRDGLAGLARRPCG